MVKIFEVLKNYKGSVATFIGLLFAIPINIRFMIQLFTDVSLSNEYLKGVAILNGIAMLWFMLPSEITIKSKLLEITLKD